MMTDITPILEQKARRKGNGICRSKGSISGSWLPKYQGHKLELAAHLDNRVLACGASGAAVNQAAQQPLQHRQLPQQLR